MGRREVVKIDLSKSGEAAAVAQRFLDPEKMKLRLKQRNSGFIDLIIVGADGQIRPAEIIENQELFPPISKTQG